MNVLGALLAAAIGAVVGYLVGRRQVTTADTKRHDFKIHVKKEPGGTYSSKTTPESERVKPGDFVIWVVNDQGSNALPKGSTVLLKFTEKNPLVSEPNDKGKREIQSFVGFGHEPKKYPYKIYYNDGVNDILLEDPELIIDGNYM